MTKVQQPTVPITPVIQPPVSTMNIPQIHPQLIPGKHSILLHEKTCLISEHIELLLINEYVELR